MPRGILNSQVGYDAGSGTQKFLVRSDLKDTSLGPVSLQHNLEFSTYLLDVTLEHPRRITTLWVGLQLSHKWVGSPNLLSYINQVYDIISRDI